jgi:ankyrin repeat protein
MEVFYPTLTHLLCREGFTALHAAAKSAHLHVVQFLVSEGADVNAVALER